MGTDVGLLRPILFGGILFQALRYSTLIISLRQLKADWQFSPTWLVYLSIILFLIFEMKGEVIAPVISIIFALAVLAAYAKETAEKK